MLKSDVSCIECRTSHYEGGKDPPCETLREHPVRKELGYWCKYGLVDPLPENAEVLDAWTFLRVFGAEAGMNLLRLRYTEAELAAMADDLLLVQGVANRHEREEMDRKAKRGGGGDS